MQVWRYAWTLAPLLATVAIGVALRGQGMTWLGAVFVVLGVVGLVLMTLKEAVERPERAHAFYRVDGPQAVYCYSFVEFLRLPQHVRTGCLKDPDAQKWFDREVQRHAGDMLGAYHGRVRWIYYRARLRLISFLT